MITNNQVQALVFKGLSDNLQAAIDTGNEPWARVLVTSAIDANIDKVQWQELRQDFETAFGDF